MAFDAYFKWLGIPPDRQPPDHYRLLGIPRLVDDADVIETAADQRMMLLRTKAGGQHGTLAEQLMQEVSRAKLCLLNAQTKIRYDDYLSEQLTPRPAASRAAEPTPPPPDKLIGPPPVVAIEPPPIVTPDAMPRAATGGDFFDKAMAAGRDWGAKARIVTRHTALFAEKTKIQNIELPQALLRLGAEVYKSGAGRVELVEYYQRIHALMVRQRNLVVDEDPEATIVEIARSTADRVKNAIESQKVGYYLNAAYRELGQVVYDGQHAAAPPAALAAVDAHLERLAEIELSLAAADSPPPH